MTNVERIATAIAKINQRIAKLKALRKAVKVLYSKGVIELDVEIKNYAESRLDVIRVEKRHLISLLKILTA